MNMDPFRSLIRTEGVRLYRDLPWRRTRDPYAIWISEVMLQQTQVVRVQTRWPRWLERFGDVRTLACASTADVLDAWQGMGYNRRALALKAAAEKIAESYDGVFPSKTEELVALPGIGPATAQGIRAFAFDLPGVYLETNVRTVFLHHFFPQREAVRDRELVGLVRETCPDTSGNLADGGDAGTVYARPQDPEDTPRSWYYALLDYGAHLKQSVPNPSRRSAGYAKQSKFEGSRRQKRAELVRLLLAAREEGGEGALSLDMATARLSGVEREAGRPEVDAQLVAELLSELSREGFCRASERGWSVA